MNYLIIEDEAYAAKHLQRKIAKIRPEWTLEKVLPNIELSIGYLSNHPFPDIIFSDIQLSDGLSFDIFRKISHYTPIVFTTAYSEYALEAFRNMGIAYLLKPIDSSELEKEINKIEAITQEKTPNEQILLALSGLLPIKKESWKERLLIKKSDKFYTLDCKDICYIISDEIGWAIDINGTKHPLDISLSAVEALLNPKDFFRINRGVIVNRNILIHAHNYFSGRLKLETTINNNQEMLVSRDRASSFKEWLTS